MLCWYGPPTETTARGGWRGGRRGGGCTSAGKSAGKSAGRSAGARGCLHGVVCECGVRTGHPHAVPCSFPRCGSRLRPPRHSRHPLPQGILCSRASTQPQRVHVRSGFGSCPWRRAPREKCGVGGDDVRLPRRTDGLCVRGTVMKGKGRGRGRSTPATVTRG